jgi:hypothetical protein
MKDDAEKATRGGWIIPGRDPVTDAADLYGVYEKAQPGYIGTLPSSGLLSELVAQLCRYRAAGAQQEKEEPSLEEGSE